MFLGLILPALASQQHRQVILRGRIVGSQFDQALELLDCLIGLTQLDIASPQAFVSRGVSRIDGKSRAVLDASLADVGLADVQIADADMHLGIVGIGGEPVIIVTDRLIELALMFQNGGQIQMGRQIFRIEFEDLPISDRGAFELVILVIEVCQAKTSVDIVWSAFEILRQ